MAGENNWEYDYSTESGAAGGESGYQNVGSSGTNTANTQDGAYQASSYNNEHRGEGSPAAIQEPTPVYGGNQGAAGAGPQYASPVPPAPRRRSRSPWPARLGAGVAVAAIGFGSGFAGAKMAGTGRRVVIRTVESPAAATSTSTATGTAMSLVDVSSMVSPSVVVITTEEMVTSNSWFGGQYVESGAGSGVVMSSDGYILTCAHVVDGATTIKVSMNDGTEYTASLVGSDPTSDIAVLKVEAEGLTPAVMGNSDTLAVGEGVVAVGNPLGELGGTVTNGIVSAVNRSVTIENQDMTLVQTNASVSPGNSGGGLFNMSGELIGIVNAKSTGDYAEGLGFAIPINTVSAVAQDLIENGYVTGRPQLGITVLEINDTATANQYGVDAMGVYVISVTDGSGAAKAGLQVGDRIVAVNDAAVTSTGDVTGVVQAASVGDTIRLQIARDGKMMNVDVILGERAAG